MNDYKFKELANQFVLALSSEHLHIIPTDIECYKHPFSFTFEIAIVIDNKYIVSPLNIGMGNVLNDLFYNEADSIGLKLFGEKPSWNNSRHVGWFIVNE